MSSLVGCKLIDRLSFFCAVNSPSNGSSAVDGISGMISLQAVFPSGKPVFYKQPAEPCGGGANDIYLTVSAVKPCLLMPMPVKGFSCWCNWSTILFNSASELLRAHSFMSKLPVTCDSSCQCQNENM